MRVARWGNSLAVRLPRSIIEQLALSEGDEVDVVPAGERRLEVARNRRKDELIARMRELSVPLPADYAFDRDGANER